MNKPRLLLVDDEERILRSLSMLFRGRYELMVTTDCGAALRAVASSRVDVVVSDQRMPQMRGAELLRQVRERSPQTMRILLTGYSELDAVVASVNEGEIFRFVTKPWDAAELSETVRQAAEIAGSLFAAPLPAPARAAADAPEAVLVIDDDAAVYESVVGALAGLPDPAPPQAIWARSIDEAFAALERHPIGVVVSELAVRGENLGSLLKPLKAQRPEIVTIVLTPFDDVSVFISLINQAQVYRLLPKPLRRGAFGMSLASALRHHRQLRAAPTLRQAHAVEAGRERADAGLAARLAGLMTRLRRQAV